MLRGWVGLGQGVLRRTGMGAEARWLGECSQCCTVQRRAQVALRCVGTCSFVQTCKGLHMAGRLACSSLRTQLVGPPLVVCRA